jgi:ribosomal protein S18 acetylase RimI-like enzyme
MRPPPVTLRPVEAGDEEFLYGVYASTRTEELAPVPWTEAQKEAFLRMQFRAQSVDYRSNYPDAEFLVILVDGAPAGRLYVHRRDDELRIVDIALLPAHRGAGIGGALLRRLLDEAAAAGKPVRIHVERFNPALRLYERLGFRSTGDDGVYFLMEWTAPEPGNRGQEGGEGPLR